MEDYFFNSCDEEMQERKVYILVIYDIVDNKRRNQLAKYLQGFGFRVQKSAFEAKLKPTVYERLKAGLKDYVKGEDSIRLYKIIGKGQVTCYGQYGTIEDNEVVII